MIQNVKNNNHEYQEDDIYTIGLEEAKEIIKSSMTTHGVSLTENDFSLTENLLSMTCEI